MRKIIYAQLTSLDGFIEDSRGKIEWTMPSDELHWHFNDLEKNVDINFYGRRTSEAMDYWLTADQNPDAPEVEIDYAKAWQKTERIVFSKTLKNVKGNASIRRGVDPEEIQKLKNKPGKNMAVGGANLASTFIRHGLVDEFRVYIHPVVLGSGKPMFPIHEKLDLKFMESQIFPGEVVMLKYQSKS